MNILHIFPPTQNLRGTTVADLEEERTTKYRTSTEVGVNAFICFFHTLRTLVKFMPSVFLTREEVNE